MYESEIKIMLCGEEMVDIKTQHPLDLLIENISIYCI